MVESDNPTRATLSNLLVKTGNGRKWRPPVIALNCKHRDQCVIEISRALLGCQFGKQVGQIVPNWEKSVTFSDQISVHFGSESQNVLKSDLKKSRIFPNLGQFDLLGGQTGNPDDDKNDVFEPLASDQKLLFIGKLAIFLLSGRPV